MAFETKQFFARVFVQNHLFKFNIIESFLFLRDLGNRRVICTDARDVDDKQLCLGMPSLAEVGPNQDVKI